MSWPVRPLGEVALSIRNGLFAKRPSDCPPGTKILRISAVRGGRVSFDDARFVDGIDESQTVRFAVEPGDVLMTRYNGSRDLVGSAGLVGEHAGPVIHPDKLIRIVLDRELAEPRFVNLQLQSPQIRRFLEPRIRTTAGQSGISGSDVRQIPLALPSLDEQRRIVAILEDHLTRLDAAADGLASAVARLAALRERAIADVITGADHVDRSSNFLPKVGTNDGVLPELPVGWEWARLGDVADVVGGVTKDAKKQNDPGFIEVPYLRVANVQRGHLKLDQVTSIRVAPEKAKTLELQVGDVLLNEGGDRDKLARGWVWEGQIDRCIHQNHVFRARVHEPRLDPYFLSWTTNTLGGRWAERNGKQSVNLASISLSMIRLMPVIVPAPGAAAQAVAELRDRLAAYDRMEAAIAWASRREEVLRRSLLGAAFSGRLTSASSNLERAHEMVGT